MSSPINRKTFGEIWLLIRRTCGLTCRPRRGPGHPAAVSEWVVDQVLLGPGQTPWHGGRSFPPSRTLPTKRSDVHENGGIPPGPFYEVWVPFLWVAMARCYLKPRAPAGHSRRDTRNMTSATAMHAMPKIHSVQWVPWLGCVSCVIKKIAAPSPANTDETRRNPGFPRWVDDFRCAGVLDIWSSVLDTLIPHLAWSRSRVERTAAGSGRDRARVRTYTLGHCARKRTPDAR
jgi:hypothetical protein